MNGKMTCERSAEILDLYLDGELNALDTREMDWHLQECAACKSRLAARQAVQSLVREHVPRYRAPLDRAPLALTGVTLEPARVRWRYAGWAVAAGLAIALLWMGTFIAQSGSRKTLPLADIQAWVVGDHLRSLQNDEAHLIDVASTDRHTVKPWFAGKLKFAPTVRDLSAQGFPLIGGRLDIVGDQEAAALVYKRDKHIINLFIWPGAERDIPAAIATVENGTGAGYHVIHWAAGGLNYWAVSDVESAELLNFQRAFESPGN